MDRRIAFRAGSLLLLICAVITANAATRDTKKSFNEAVRAENYLRAYQLLEPDLRGTPKQASSAANLFVKSPGFSVGLRTDLMEKCADANSMVDARALDQTITFAMENGALSRPDAAILKDELARHVVDSVASGATLASIGEDTRTFPALLTSTRSQSILVSAALVELQKQSPANSHRRGVAKELFLFLRSQPQDSAARTAVAACLPQMRFTLRELREDVHPVFPEQTALAIAYATKPFSIATNPLRRLLEIDVLALVRADSSFGFRPAAPNEPADIGLEIRELAYQEQPGSAQTKTLTLNSYQVDTVYSVLWMPKGASFVFDVVTTDAKIEYAYEILIHRNGRPDAARLVRDSSDDHVSQCANPRIVNVFGGVSGANGWPPSVSQQYCAAASQSTGMKGLRQGVVERVASESAAMLVEHGQ